MEKKKNWCRMNWATAQLYCEKKKNLYCNTVFVLQRRKLGELKLYCKRVKCIAIEAAWLLKKLYCNTVWWAAGLYRNTNCIVSLGKAWVVIQHGQALGARSWVLRHGAGRCDKARHRRAPGRHAGSGGGAGKRGARGRRTLGRRAGAAGGRCLGARASFGLCTRCTRPVFGPVRLGIFFLSHQMNTVHCKINFEKKNVLNLIKIKSNQIKFDKIFEK